MKKILIVVFVLLMILLSVSGDGIKLLETMFAIECGYIFVDGVATFDTTGIQDGYYVSPPDSTYVKLDFEFQILKNLIFIGGYIDSRQFMTRWDNWRPYRIIYDFNTGIRFKNFEIGFEHLCDHNVVTHPQRNNRFIAAGNAHAYLRYENKF